MIPNTPKIVVDANRVACYSSNMNTSYGIFPLKEGMVVGGLTLHYPTRFVTRHQKCEGWCVTDEKGAKCRVTEATMRHAVERQQSFDNNSAYIGQTVSGAEYGKDEICYGYVGRVDSVRPDGKAVVVTRGGKKFRIQYITEQNVTTYEKWDDAVSKQRKLAKEYPGCNGCEEPSVVD